jgi:flagellar biosynthesis/type III secretory pathway ATPase
MEFTVVVAASAADNAANQVFAPFSGTAIGEWFMENGQDALIVYDDLSKHAAAYRQISLILKRPSSTSTPASSSAPRASPARARSPRCRSSRRRPATCPRTSRPT